jgi:curved DNA-binding protein CbpA
MKSYYATLGVLPTAEDAVIRAAYKALAQRYHPDRNPGSAEAAAKMAELNEAYDVLSDPERRKRYDELHASDASSADPYFGSGAADEDEGEQAAPDPLAEDWTLALKYYPDLELRCKRLAKISRRLEFTYKAFLLETKSFRKRDEIQKNMERQFMQLYFGTNPQVLSYAEALINDGRKAAALGVNKVVSVLGSEVDPTEVISRIEREFPMRHSTTAQPSESGWRTDTALGKAIAGVRVLGPPVQNWIALINAMGGSHRMAGFIFHRKHIVELGGKHHEFDDSIGMTRWLQDEILPMALARMKASG